MKACIASPCWLICEIITPAQVFYIHYRILDNFTFLSLSIMCSEIVNIQKEGFVICSCKDGRQMDQVGMRGWHCWTAAEAPLDKFWTTSVSIAIRQCWKSINYLGSCEFREGNLPRVSLNVEVGLAARNIFQTSVKMVLIRDPLISPLTVNGLKEQKLSTCPSIVHDQISLEPCPVLYQGKINQATFCLQAELYNFHCLQWELNVHI